MDPEDQEAAFTEEMNKLIKRYFDEFDLTPAQVAGILGFTIIGLHEQNWVDSTDIEDFDDFDDEE